jgi:CheY-like chemotaxis protein
VGRLYQECPSKISLEIERNQGNAAMHRLSVRRPAATSVLVVDDSCSSTMFRVDMLCRQLQQRGFCTDVAYDGEEGLRLLKLRHRDYAFVLSDLEMSHKTGPQMVAEFRKWEARQLERERDANGRIPLKLFICSMSVNGEAEDRKNRQEETREEPATHNAFIDKPVTEAKLSYVVDMADSASQWSASW